MTEPETNRLIQEKSPYLLQHAHNPVDWFPWGEEAFARARRADRPIFLSIGYSTCHWCHVMERESFEDPEVAGALNEAFVSVKVDREERPDLDHVYMTVCQLLTGSGGWPLTVILTPDGKPFFAGTYLPKRSRFGRLGMMELVERVKNLWQGRREEVLTSADRILDALRTVEQTSHGEDLTEQVLEEAYRQLEGRFDADFGGFSEAPKFPTAHNLLFLLRYWKRSGEPEALGMATRTLEALRRGGIWDHVGYGFHRYATDREWLVPHFEKMLYDQALLAIAFLEGYQATGDARWAETARAVVQYVLRDLKDQGGAFYSAEDADSEGVEGKFYVWREAEIREVLEEDLAELAVRIFQVEGQGNFLEEASGKRSGANILHRRISLAEEALRLGMEPDKLGERLEQARRRLLRAREGRVRPHLDDKILTDWNGLMIAALARAAQVLGDAACEQAAVAAADFVLRTLRRPDGRLLHRYREGQAAIPAHLDDYAFLVWGLIELYQATFAPAWLEAAVDLQRDMLALFWDEERGGFFFTAADAEQLILRKKEIHDGALPSGNAVALSNLLQLARLTGEPGLEERAWQVARSFSETIRQLPSGYTFFLGALDFAFGPGREVVIAGEPGKADTLRMLEALRSRFLPNKVVLLRPIGKEASADIERLAPFVRNYESLGGKATAYVCLRHACQAPTTRVPEMLESMG